MLSLRVSSDVDVTIDREYLVVLCNANRLMFGVFTFTLTHFLAKTIFSRGYGVYKIVMEIPKGWGREAILVVKTWKFRGGGGGGGLREIPSVVGVWIFSGTTHYYCYCYYYYYYYCYCYYYYFYLIFNTSLTNIKQSKV